jgi:rare lipoprotein A
VTTPDIFGLHSSVPIERPATAQPQANENFTAAHRSLPFGTLVHVDNQTTRRSAVVRITDRGPFIGGRIIDASQVAARPRHFRFDAGLSQRHMDARRSASREK